MYAVSVDHAKNLAEVFREGGEPAEVLLGDTPTYERRRSIRQFSDGDLKVLVNVAVATEGFDLPDASCVVLTRPTLSLALYLQMVGRGLRPKSDGSDCLILDLAGNVERHGFPEDVRGWSLEPRGNDDGNGLAPTVRCSECSGVSPAASHYCRHCNAPLGKDCERCGKWRAWQTWSAEFECGDEHDPVCNRCHVDAHEQGTLPEVLKEAMREELRARQSKVNISNLNTLEEVRYQLCEVSEDLVHLMRTDDRAASMLGDSHPFNLATKQMRSLLRRETELKKVREKSFISEIEATLSPELQPVFNDFAEEYSKLGKKVIEVKVEFDYTQEKVQLEITYEENGKLMRHKV